MVLPVSLPIVRGLDPITAKLEGVGGRRHLVQVYVAACPKLSSTSTESTLG